MTIFQPPCYQTKLMWRADCHRYPPSDPAGGAGGCESQR